MTVSEQPELVSVDVRAQSTRERPAEGDDPAVDEGGTNIGDGRSTARTYPPLLRELEERRRSAVDGPSPEANRRRREQGRHTARERIDLLLDKGSFHEVEMLRRHKETGFGLERQRPYTDGVVTGWGTIEGRKVFVYAHDFRIYGGSLGQAHAAKIHKVMDMAIAVGAPLISLNDGAGARIQEGVASLAGYGGIFRRNVRASGVIPQISVILGPCAGGASYSPALTDFVMMVRGSGRMFLTGPDVIREVTGEEISHEDLGGADVHAVTSGVASFVFDDEQECLEAVRELLALLPSNNRELPAREPSEEPADRECTELFDLVPADPGQPYDMVAVVEELVDDGYHLPVSEDFAPNLLCTLGRLDGEVVGIVANQPMHMGGVLDIRASEKGARFVRMCDAFNIPLVTLVDVPGFLPGSEQERGGIIRHGAKLLHAYCAATVPRIQVILRKAYGGAYIVMDSLSVGCDLAYTWPGNEIAVMGARGAAQVIHRRSLAEADDPDALLARLTEDYTEQLAHPYYAAEHGLVDAVIDPTTTREVLCSGLAMLASKNAETPERKHSNPPM